jgi:hypothetical protein
MSFLYRGYGVTLSSEIALPELRHGSGEPDVRIRLGSVPKEVPDAVEVGARFTAGPGEYILDAEGIGRYQVSAGKEITLDLQNTADPGAVRLHLLATVMGILAHQRGRLPFHGGAIQVAGGAVVLAGRSSTGKSTLLATLQNRGYNILCDDIAVASLDDSGLPRVEPGSVRVKLWRDAMLRLGLNPANFERVRPEIEKYSMPIENGFCDGALRLDRLYFFERPSENGAVIAPVEGIEAFSVIRRATFRPRSASALGAGPAQLEIASAIARESQVANMHRSTRPGGVDELADALERDWARTPN